ncbi:haloalkane dehalogenase [Aliidongia dinghuensis]|uniref:Haloalkane dehalogenase n=1 Tax=Aliidongia dinghuensis TaxID=1867774 RepID=A0A8J2YR11_9PROT|nr:haloalkane dehalogenase [Aliidongia dinghuensis]GGF09247.1 haloalkane dehalogenase [Aliidongia dinghuensis]
MTHHEIAVLGSTMSYIEAGSDGPTVLFLHGNPTSSFIWRNIIPQVAPVARCIAPDLIGFGRSGKPDIDYRFADHARYLDAFIAALGLDRLVIVAQDWGTALAFHHARRRPETMLGLAFMEFIRPFANWDAFHQRPQARDLFQAIRTPGQGERLVLEDNVFIERVLPGSVIRPLAAAEMDAYRTPFPTPETRKPILRLPRELPVAGEPADVHAASGADHAALAASTYPKLLFCGEPGALVSPAAAAEFARTLKDCRVVNLGPGAHYLQEDHPETIGRMVRTWLVEAGIAAETGHVPA